ncbi:UNVERIFIED_CONTAM: hypothetical protein NY100_03265 [Prevotella sp. 15_C9]
MPDNTHRLMPPNAYSDDGKQTPDSEHSVRPHHEITLQNQRLRHAPQPIDNQHDIDGDLKA